MVQDAVGVGAESSSFFASSPLPRTAEIDAQAISAVTSTPTLRQVGFCQDVGLGLCLGRYL